MANADPSKWEVVFAWQLRWAFASAALTGIAGLNAAMKSLLTPRWGRR